MRMSSTDEMNPSAGEETSTEPQPTQVETPAPPVAAVADEANAVTAPTEAASKPAEDVEEVWEEEPGDDIGNRLPGAPAPRRPAPAAATPAAGAAASPAKKKRRRRRRKGPANAEATGGASPEANAEAASEDEASDEHGDETDAAEAVEGETEAKTDSEGEQKPKDRKKRRGPPPAAAREKPAFGIGTEVFGKVERVTEDAVWIDIAGKAKGLFDRRELAEDDVPQIDDQFLATVASVGLRGGMLVLSRAAADLDKARALLEAAAQSGDLVEGFVTGAVKGGLEVDIGGLRAFAPASHVELRHGADLSGHVGRRLDFTVAQFAKKGRDVVVSRKKMLEEVARKERTESLSKVEPGSIQHGIVRTVMPWGVFVALPELGGIEGLVHATEASHDRGAKLEAIFKVGETIDVKVLRVDEKGKLWLSRKAAQSDPWDEVRQKYAVGTKHRGKIARLQPFGAFIELETGIDGLCHTADLSLKPIEHPNEVVNVGDEIDVVVASLDPSGHRIGLHPALPPGEEDEPRQKVQLYKPVKVAVVQATEGGLIVRILGVTGRAARGFIPAGQTGTQRGTDLRKEFPVGTKLDVKVVDADARRSDVKLSIRALKDDAEKHAYQQYRAGVAREAKFGTFADLMKKH